MIKKDVFDVMNFWWKASLAKNSLAILLGFSFSSKSNITILGTIEQNLPQIFLKVLFGLSGTGKTTKGHCGTAPYIKCFQRMNL